MHVAFIAMSGIRVRNERLLELGLTLPGFVERSRVIASMPSLSLLTLAGMTPDRFEVSYHEVEDVRKLGELPDCDLAAIATFSAQAKEAYALSERFRAQDVRTVLGGLHATAVPDEAARYVDAVVVGEGEPCWEEVLRDAAAGRLRRRYVALGCEFDLADAPLPRFELLDPERYNRLPIQTQRGCPWRCDFCASSILLTKRFKVKPVAKVVEEIRAVKRIWPRPFIELADDNSFVRRRHARELVTALGEEEVRWFTETDISVADDDELLRLMSEAGCEQVLIGLESPEPESLDGLELRRNWKRTRAAGYAEAVQRIQSHGITVNGCFVLGLDGSTRGAVDAIRRFVETSGLFEVQITVMTPFPGTPLYERLRGKGRLLDPTGWEKCTLFDVNFRPAAMTPGELEEDLYCLAAELYTAEAKRSRARRFVAQSGGRPSARVAAQGGGAASTELTDDPAFGGRVRRLAVVSALALGALTGLWWADVSGAPGFGALLTAGWVTMPLLLAASLRKPLLRYGLVLPVLLVGTPVVAAALGREGVDGVARAGWILVAAGIALGALLGLWFWYRLFPVPERLDDPFSQGRLILIAVHVAAVTAGIATIFEASVA